MSQRRSRHRARAARRAARLRRDRRRNPRHGPAGPVRLTRQRSAKSARSMRSPMARRPNTVASTTSASASAARSISIVRRNAELSNTIVSCGSQASRPPAPTDYAAVDLGDIGRGAIDLLAGLRRHRRRGAVADRDRPVEAVAAGQPAGRVDQHGLQRIADGSRHPDLGGALLIETVDARPAAGTGARRVRRAPRRAGRAVPLRIAVHAACSRPLPSCASGQRPGRCTH